MLRQEHEKKAAVAAAKMAGKEEREKKRSDRKEKKVQGQKRKRERKEESLRLRVRGLVRRAKRLSEMAEPKSGRGVSAGEARARRVRRQHEVQRDWRAAVDELESVRAAILATTRARGPIVVVYNS